MSAPRPPTQDEIGSRRAALEARLRRAAEGGGHDPERLRIVAVTKGWPVDVARAAMQVGLAILGESRVQEAEPKVALLPDAEWHLVGRLQSNKARRAIRTFASIHSVESVDLLERLDAVALEERRSTRVLLQVNVAGTPTTAGMAPEAVDDEGTVAAIAGLRAVRLEGLMTIAPLHAQPDDDRATFAALRELRDRLERRAGVSLPELSMGMSADAELAAAEGATLVRIGTALFGSRR